MCRCAGVLRWRVTLAFLRAFTLRDTFLIP